jgi:hypothetical protein
MYPQAGSDLATGSFLELNEIVRGNEVVKFHRSHAERSSLYTSFANTQVSRLDAQHRDFLKLLLECRLRLQEQAKLALPFVSQTLVYNDECRAWEP